MTEKIRSESKEYDTCDIEQTLQELETNDMISHDLVIIEKDDLLFNELKSMHISSNNNNNNNEETSSNSLYNTLISIHSDNCEEKPLSIQRSLSIPKDAQNKEPISSNLTKIEHVEKQKIENIDHYPILRLVQPTCEGIRERIELLGELLISDPLDQIPDVYDEMAHIIAATERNERLQADPHGKRLLELTTAARSNLNVDLDDLDLELQRQFGLYSVEVTGDGACAFRAILISGMQRSDRFHSELRYKAIKQVLDDISYYSTVLRPGETVTEKELNNWAEAMKDPYTYGDEMTNIAIADAYHIQLVIFHAGELLTVVNPRDGRVHHTAFLVNVGTHYKALVPKHQLEQARQNSERLCK